MNKQELKNDAYKKVHVKKLRKIHFRSGIWFYESESSVKMDEETRAFFKTLDLSNLKDLEEADEQRRVARLEANPNFEAENKAESQSDPSALANWEDDNDPYVKECVRELKEFLGIGKYRKKKRKIS
ncbi:MAG TPA: hypothetical protein VIU12_17095 [Chryseolinea sp.]